MGVVVSYLSRVIGYLYAKMKVGYQHGFKYRFSLG